MRNERYSAYTEALLRKYAYLIKDRLLAIKDFRLLNRALSKDHIIGKILRANQSNGLLRWFSSKPKFPLLEEVESHKNCIIDRRIAFLKGSKNPGKPIGDALFASKIFDKNLLPIIFAFSEGTPLPPSSLDGNDKFSFSTSSRPASFFSGSRTRHSVYDEKKPESKDETSEQQQMTSTLTGIIEKELTTFLIKAQRGQHGDKDDKDEKMQSVLKGLREKGVLMVWGSIEKEVLQAVQKRQPEFPFLLSDALINQACASVNVNAVIATIFGKQTPTSVFSANNRAKEKSLGSDSRIVFHY